MVRGPKRKKGYVLFSRSMLGGVLWSDSAMCIYHLEFQLLTKNEKYDKITKQYLKRRERSDKMIGAICFVTLVAVVVFLVREASNENS